jgi:hypothetical protein
MDAHRNEECIIIGNGPSLNSVPQSFLDSNLTIGTNRIYLKRVPDYYVCINELVLEQFKIEIMALRCPKFVRENTGYFDVYPLHMTTTKMFSFSPTKWLYDGCNVTFVALQLAFFMGFHTVKLVGVDHRYEYEGKPNQVLDMKGDDPNHFNPSYFKGAKWQAPDLVTSEKAYRMAKEAYETNGRRIVNMTVGSALDVFEKEPIPWER